MKKRKFFTMTIILLLIISSSFLALNSSTFTSYGISGDKHARNTTENKLNITFYNALTHLNVTTEPSHMDLELGEADEGHMMIKNMVGREFLVKLILTNEEWIPEYEGIEGYIGQRGEEEIKFYHNWLKKLEKKTSDMHSLDYDAVEINRTDVKKNISYSVRVERGGYFNIIPLVKPHNQSCWMMLTAGISLYVDKPDNLAYRYGYIIFPSSIMSILSYITYRRKYRIK